jgi:hypothetical protein
VRERLRANSPDALYARLGPLYVERYNRALYATAFLFAMPATWVALVLVTDAPAWTYLLLFAAGAASTVGTLSLCVRFSRHSLAPATSWTPDADEEATLAAWRAVVRTVPDSVLPCFAKCVAFSGLPWAVLVAITLSLSPLETLLAIACIVVFALYPVALNSTAFELFLGPLKRDIGRHLPGGYAIERPFPSMRQWLLALLPIVTLVNGLFVAFYASAVHDPTA